MNRVSYDCRPWSSSVTVTPASRYRQENQNLDFGAVLCITRLTKVSEDRIKCCVGLQGLDYASARWIIHIFLLCRRP